MCPDLMFIEHPDSGNKNRNRVPRIPCAGHSRAPLSSAELYDPATNTWMMATSATYARGRSAAVRLNDGSVLVLGGDNTGGSVATA